MNIKYQHIQVKVTDEDASAFTIIARVTNALKHDRVPIKEIQEFQYKAFSCKSYTELLNFIRETVSVF